MRRPARLALGVLAATTLVLTPAMVGTSAAAPAKGPSASQSAKTKPAKAKPSKAKPAKAAKPAKPAKPSKAKSKVTIVGVVSDTRTVTTQGSDTSTVVITVQVQGGEREYHRKAVTISVPKDAVVKRNHGKKARYELKKGDKVTVHARRDAAGALTAYYVAASGRKQVTPAPSASPATSTATTSS